MRRTHLRYQFYVGWGSHGFFVKKSSVVFAFGRNTFGQLSLGDRKSRSSPTRVKYFDNKELVYASLGHFHSLFFTKNGCFSCGLGVYGILSVGDSKDRLVGVQIILEEKEIEVRDVFAGANVSYFLSREGEVFSVGQNENGSLCLGDTNNDRVVGTKVRLKEKIKNIVGGMGSVFFMTCENKIFGGGNNTVGQLGIGNKDNQLIPVELKFFNKKAISFIACSAGSSYFLCDNGSVFVCGLGRDLAMGDDLANYVLSPILSKSLSNVEYLSGQSFQFIVWKSNSNFYGTGIHQFTFLKVNAQIGVNADDGKNNRYGFGNTRVELSPKRISFENVGKYDQILSGFYNTYFISKDGQRVAGCGNNAYGQLMNGTFQPIQDSVQLLGSELDLKPTNINQPCEKLKYVEISKRTEFAISLPKDLTIDFGDQKLQCFSSIILPSSFLFKTIQNGILKVDDVKLGSMNENLLLKYFFGFEQDEIGLVSIIELYEVLSKLKLKEFELCLLKGLCRLRTLEKVIKMFVLSFNRFEKLGKDSVSGEMLDEDNIFDVYCCDEFSFRSLFNVQLFNLLCCRLEEIRKVPNFLQVLEKLQVWSKLIQHKKSPIGESVHFGGCKKFESPADVFQNHCRELWKYRNKTGNYIILSKDEKEIAVHKEIIVVRSDYFFRVIEFGGCETRREGFLCLERLDHEELMLIVEFIYINNIKIVGNEEELLLRLVNLLDELDPLYKDFELRECIIEKMTVLTRKMIESGEFEKEILPEIGWLISDSSKRVSVESRQHFMRVWGQEIERKKLVAIVEKSVCLRAVREKDIEIMEIEKTLGKKVEGHGKRFDQIEERFSKIDGDITDIKKGMNIIEKDVGDLKQGMTEILNHLKRNTEITQRRSKRKRVKSDEEEEREKKFRKKETQK